MKQVLIIISFIISCNACYSQCSRSNTQSIAIGVDVTDRKHLDQFRTWAMQEMQTLEQYLDNRSAFQPCGSVETSVLKISDLGESRISKTGFKPIDPKLSDKQIRSKVIIPYFKSLLEIIHKSFFSDDLVSTKYTRIWEPMCKYLHQYASRKKEVLFILFTDGLEHNEAFSLYNHQEIDVTTFEERLTKACHIDLPEDLSHVRFVIVSYRFSDNDRLITKSQHCWRTVLEKRGAKVYTASSLELENLIK